MTNNRINTYLLLFLAALVCYSLYKTIWAPVNILDNSVETLKLKKENDSLEEALHNTQILLIERTIIIDSLERDNRRITLNLKNKRAVYETNLHIYDGYTPDQIRKFFSERFEQDRHRDNGATLRNLGDQ